MSELFLEGFGELHILFAKKFMEDADQMVKHFDSTTVPLQIMMQLYRHYENTGEIERIEDLNIGTKNKLWNHVKVCCPEVGKDRAIEISKAIWLINSVM